MLLFASWILPTRSVITIPSDACSINDRYLCSLSCNNNSAFFFAVISIAEVSQCCLLFSSSCSMDNKTVTDFSSLVSILISRLCSCPSDANNSSILSLTVFLFSALTLLINPALSADFPKSISLPDSRRVA